MLIRFLRDYRGALTGENFFLAGEVVDIERGDLIVAEGAAEPAEPPALDEVGLPFDAPTEPARGRGRRA